MDGNHAQVVRELRQAGVYVLDIHALPGVLDLVAAVPGLNLLVELKDPDRPASKRKPTEAEERLLATWPGPKLVATCTEEILRALGRL